MTVGPPTTAIYDLAVATLNAVVAEWPDDATDLPDIRFVSNGQPAVDGCDVLAVSWERNYSNEGDPGLEQLIALGPGFAIKANILAVWLFRCVPMIDGEGDEAIFPSVAETQASALMILTDVQAVNNALVAAHARGTIGGCGRMTIDGGNAVNPQGGVGGSVTRVRLYPF